MAHIYGVRPGAERYRADMPASERDSFENLLLLCMAHHEEVDGKGGADLYPSDLLKRWKAQHEGDQRAILSSIRIPSEEWLAEALTAIAEPPIKRLESLADRLEQTGAASAATVQELRSIAGVLSGNGMIGSEDVSRLVYVAHVLEDQRLRGTADKLGEVLAKFSHEIGELENLIRRMNR